MQMNSGQPKPWYREPWPWVAIAIPAAAVIMGVTMLGAVAVLLGNLTADVLYAVVDPRARDGAA